MMGIISWDSKSHFNPPQTPMSFVPHNEDLFPETVAADSLKRKRSFDLAIAGPIDLYAVKAPISVEPQCKRARQDAGALPQVVHSIIPESATTSPVQTPEVDCTNTSNDIETNVLENTPAHTKSLLSHDVKLAMARQTISTQINLEILLKHRELRLIDQELAKCQVALEQLRRCTEIPFPAMQSPSEQVSFGRGAPVRRPKERWPARSPAPWGVTDGPYTRHYAKWLLPDSHFDGGRPEVVATADSTPISASGRHIRGTVPDFAQLAGKSSRSVRAFNHAALPAGYGEPKQKPTGPMILKRKSDGKMVKLICPDCGRHDFGSAQGFINHCRIGHQRNFASHDAAAEGCGEPVEVDESGIIKGAPAEMTPMSTSIHPMVRSAKLISSKTPGQPILKGGYVSRTGRSRKPKKSKSALQTPACAQAPYLSTFIQDKAASVDLQGLVTEVKSEIVTIETELETEDDEVVDSPVMYDGNGRPIGAGKMHAMKSTAPGRRIGGGKQLLSQARQKQDSESSVATSHDDNYMSSFMSLLPSPTNESTQAPSLIDDDDEPDPQSPVSTTDFDEHDVDVRVHDDEHPEVAQELRAQDLHSPQTTCVPRLSESISSPVARPLVGKDNRSTILGHNNIHQGKEESNDRKRRRLEE